MGNIYDILPSTVWQGLESWDHANRIGPEPKPVECSCDSLCSKCCTVSPDLQATDGSCRSVTGLAKILPDGEYIGMAFVLRRGRELIRFWVEDHKVTKWREEAWMSEVQVEERIQVNSTDLWSAKITLLQIEGILINEKKLNEAQQISKTLDLIRSRKWA